MLNRFDRAYRALFRGVALAIVLVAATATSQPKAAGKADAALPPPPGGRVLLDKYCVGCHNERLKTANLMLDKANVEDVSAAAETWEKVLKKLRTGAMPPAGSPRPDKSQSDALASWLQSALDQNAAAHPMPGRPAVHRLNRAEYANAIRDLVGIDIDARALLPVDDAGYGFDNIADVLSVSPGLLERYMSAANKISHLVVGDSRIRPSIQTYSAPKYLVQDDRMNEELPFGSRGGIVIHHYFPLDAEYSVKVKLQRTWRDEIRGLAVPHQLEIRVDRRRVKLFTIGGAGERSTWLPGQAVPNPTEYELSADAGLEIRIPVKAGQRAIAVTFLKDTAETEGALRPDLPVTSFEFAGNREGEPAVDTVQIAGPYNAAGPGETASRRRVFVCEPTDGGNEERCARRILQTLSRRAYRRPVNDADVQVLLGFYQTGRRSGGFDAGIEFAMRRVLVSPEFLFRIEQDPVNAKSGSAYRLSDLELASRLSFFLWSSIPDDQLLDLAERGQLKNPAILDQQVKRMLADSRSTALIDNFTGQWLYLRNMRTHAPDPEAFPEFDDNLRDAFQKETELFVTSQFREDRSILDLLTANYSFLNERLAKHYGIPDVYGSHFRRVTFNDDRRGGLLGQGSILTVTSYPTRTSPVGRGKWLLENILGTPPPPPPPNVPSLADKGASGKPASVRERMEAHRSDPVCASCHARMDPLGFALENFDGIGRWRVADEGATAIDASGMLPDGTKFQGPAGLRQALVTRGDEFVATVTEKLLTYALGRGVEYYDAPAVRNIAAEAARSGNRWSALVLGIVRSVPFQMRTAQDGNSVATTLAEAKGTPWR
jgi:mono/diheme cytochrome c family protein